MPMYPYTPNEIRNKERKLHVNGSSRLSVQPDIATIHIGVISENADLQLAEQQNTQTVQEILSAFKQIGLNNHQIHSSHFNVHPISGHNDNPPQVSGYRVTNEIRVTTNKIDQIGTIISLAIQHGANNINGLTFGLKNEQKWYEKALNNAVVDAISKAQSIATVLNVTIDSTPRKITEESRQPQPFMQTYSVQSIAATTPIHPDEVVIEANVKVVFYY